MDGLSVASSVIAVLDIGAKVAQTSTALRVRKIPTPSNLVVYHIYFQILQDIASSISASHQNLPSMITLALQDCKANLAAMDGVVFAYERRSDSKKELQVHIQIFIDQVRALLSMLNFASISHIQDEIHALRRVQIAEQEQMLSRIIERLESSEQDHRDPGAPNDDYRADLELLESQLRKNVENLRSNNDYVKDPFAFTARIIGSSEELADHIVIRGVIDTGCWDNWVSMEALTRSSTEGLIEDFDQSQSFAGFEGGFLKPVGKVSLTWYTVNTALSRKSDFLVHQQGPFDMVLGKSFIKAENILVFTEPVLALRHANLSKEDFHELERTAKEKKDSQKEIAVVRKAKDAEARERMRREKAASRLMSPTSVFSRRSSFLYSPPPERSKAGVSNLSRTFTSLSLQNSMYHAPTPMSPESILEMSDVPEEERNAQREEKETGECRYEQPLGPKPGPSTDQV